MFYQEEARYLYQHGQSAEFSNLEPFMDNLTFYSET